MTRDELEFSISQYLDGTLAEAARGALEERLAIDGEARGVFAEYQSLQSAFAAAPLPEVRWDQLARHISAAVAREEMPAQSYRISAWQRPTLLAMAASVVIAAGIGFTLMKSGSGDTLSEPTRIIWVDASMSGVVASTSPAVEQPIRIAIGPSAGAQEEPIVLRYADSVVQRPSKAVIVSAAVVGQDSLMTPF